MPNLKQQRRGVLESRDRERSEDSCVAAIEVGHDRTE
jgi:hypothetical protein